jgi:hypothetical protein
MTTIKELQDELEPYKNTLVLNFFEVVRLVGVTEDEDDFYWIFDNGKEIVHSSCVCNWIPIKGKLDDNSYNQLVMVWNLNNDIAVV